MTPDIHVASFRNGDHICFFYRDTEEQLATAAPFVQVGLLRGERCLCILPQASMDALFAWLDSRGINPQKEMARGALLTATAEESYLKGGRFDREEMAGFLDMGMKEALHLGFSGFRGTGDLTWAVNDARTCGHLEDYELLLDRYYPGKQALGICMYNTALFDGGQLERLMDAHRMALTSANNHRRTIRIRNAVAFGEVIFDRELARVFHYTLQKHDGTELLNVGQESTLTAAMDAVESGLRALGRAQA
jgi:MEDS: MEthanogen/methylotroph, DcmR Sensory domain